nr:sigma-70 family RNA polymerase sigma factor [Paenibacillus sp. SZ31]
MVTMFLKVALRIALRNHEKFGYPLDETIQNANIGLLLAVEKIPVDKNLKYSTYATWWVRQYIARETQGISRVFYTFPAHVREKLLIVVNTKRSHDCSQCISGENCINLIECIAKQLNIDKNRAIWYLKILEDPLSIEQLISFDDCLLSDYGDQKEKLMLRIYKSNLKYMLYEAFSILNSKEKQVLEFRYGLLDGKQKTLEEIGAIYGVTRERIRQIESKALNKLRSRYSKDYFGFS